MPLKRIVLFIILLSFMAVPAATPQQQAVSPDSATGTESSYKRMSVALIFPDKNSPAVKDALEYNRYVGMNVMDMDAIFNDLTAAFQKNFKSAVRAEKMADAKELGVDLAAVIDIRYTLPYTVYSDVTYDVVATIMTPAQTAIDKARGASTTRMKIDKAWGPNIKSPNQPFSFGNKMIAEAIKVAAETAEYRMMRQLRASGPLAAFAGSVQFAEKTTPVAPPAQAEAAKAEVVASAPAVPAAVPVLVPAAPVVVAAAEPVERAAPAPAAEPDKTEAAASVPVEAAAPAAAPVPAAPEAPIVAASAEPVEKSAPAAAPAPAASETVSNAGVPAPVVVAASAPTETVKVRTKKVKQKAVVAVASGKTTTPPAPMTTAKVQTKKAAPKAVAVSSPENTAAGSAPVEREKAISKKSGPTVAAVMSPEKAAPAKPETDARLSSTPTAPAPEIAKAKPKKKKPAPAASTPSTPVVAAPAPLAPVAAGRAEEKLSASAAGKQVKNAYAIVIGVERYRQKLPAAEFATHDAQAVKEALTKVMGYSAENIITLVNEQATRADVAKHVEKWLQKKVKAGSSVFIYFSGLGTFSQENGEDFLVPYDGDLSFIEQTGYSLQRLSEVLGHLPAKDITLVLDSCFSGAGGRSVMLEGAKVQEANQLGSRAFPGNMTVLAASTGNQACSSYQAKGQGLFTHFMLKGIKSEDVMRMPDGSIDLGDLFSYVKPQVERIARNQAQHTQSPQLITTKK